VILICRNSISSGQPKRDLVSRKDILFLMLFFFMASAAIGQTEEKSPTGKFLRKRGYTFPGEAKSHKKRSDRWPDTLYYNTRYRARFLGSPTIPISFTRAEFKNSQYQLSPDISLGYGYTWFFGYFTFSEDDKVIVNPTLFIGLIADIGIQNKLGNYSFNLTKPAGFFTGGFVGSQAFSLFAGFDWVAKSLTAGIGSRIDVYTLSQKALRPIGKVKSMRRHKKFAIPISDD
jgi:hypothetical protein